MKIYNDISESDIKTCKCGLIFYFSSEALKNKFENLYNYYIKEENLKMLNKYKVKVNNDLMLSISLYKKVEKRGFRVVDTVGNKFLTENNLYLINNILNY